VWPATSAEAGTAPALRAKVPSVSSIASVNTVATGQCNVKAYNRELANLIHHGKAKPSFIISHELGLDQAPDAYNSFDNREDGWTKVVLKPEMAAA